MNGLRKIWNLRKIRRTEKNQKKTERKIEKVEDCCNNHVKPLSCLGDRVDMS